MQVKLIHNTNAGLRVHMSSREAENTVAPEERLKIKFCSSNKFMNVFIYVYLRTIACIGRMDMLCNLDNQPPYPRDV